METGPIIRAALRNKTGAVLIALQIAFTMTVVINAWFAVSERLGVIARPSGVVEDDTFHVESVGFAADFNARVTVDEDLATLRQIPGVVDAVQMNAIPLGGSGWSSGLRAEPGAETQSFGAAVYMVDEHGLDTLGVRLVAGENLAAGDVIWRERNAGAWPAKVIVTEALGEALFPGVRVEEVVGKTAYIANDHPMMIVGVIERLQAPWTGSQMVERSMLVPQKMAFESARYMIRALPGERDRLMPEIEAVLASTNTKRIVRNLESMNETRERGYALDQGLARLLIFIMVVLVLITAVGVLGLASFSVTQRTKQIGTRRALGATRADILRYFLVENLFITTAGVLLGGLMTVVVNAWLVDAMSFPKIHWLGVPLGMIALILVSQAAVLGPARRACRVSPAVATRTV